MDLPQPIKETSLAYQELSKEPLSKAVMDSANAIRELAKKSESPDLILAMQEERIAIMNSVDYLKQSIEVEIDGHGNPSETIKIVEIEEAKQALIRSIEAHTERVKEAIEFNAGIRKILESQGARMDKCEQSAIELSKSREVRSIVGNKVSLVLSCKDKIGVMKYIKIMEDLVEQLKAASTKAELLKLTSYAIDLFSDKAQVATENFEASHTPITHKIGHEKVRSIPFVNFG